jgi:DNA-binding beta-propeller fold protein YncE
MKGRRTAAGVLAALVMALIAVPAAAQGATGVWKTAWGKDVVTGGGTGFEVCTVAINCKVGVGTGELGGELDSPAAVAVDSANAYVADTDHDRIQRLSLAGVFSRTWGKDVLTTGGTGFEVCLVAANCQGAAASTGLGGEIDSAEGVAVDPDGNVYVSERLNNRIEKFGSAGNFIAAWGKDVVTGGGTGFEVCTVAANCKKGVSGGLGGEFNSPNGIAADGSFVYVADRVNNRIQKFTPAGTFLRTWGKDVVTGGGTGLEVCDTASLCKAGAGSTGLGGELNTPVAVASDDEGSVYVADTNGNQVQKFDSVGTWERTWGKDVINGGSTGFEVCTTASACKKGNNSGGLGGELNQPIGIAADGTSVFVTDPYWGRIQEFDPSGRFFALWGGDVVNGGGTGFELCTDAALCKPGALGGAGGFMQLPGGLALDGTALYAADSGNNRIQGFGVEAPVFPPATGPPAIGPSASAPPAKKKKCKKKKHKRSASAAKKKKCKKKRKK